MDARIQVRSEAEQPYYSQMIDAASVRLVALCDIHTGLLADLGSLQMLDVRLRYAMGSRRSMLSVAYPHRVTKS